MLSKRLNAIEKLGAGPLNFGHTRFCGCYATEIDTGY